MTSAKKTLVAVAPWLLVLVTTTALIAGGRSDDRFGITREQARILSLCRDVFGVPDRSVERSDHADGGGWTAGSRGSAKGADPVQGADQEHRDARGLRSLQRAGSGKRSH